MKRPSEFDDETLFRLARQAEEGLPDAPRWLVDSALALWQAPLLAPPLGRRIAVALGFDSWAAQPALALRSASLESRQLLFSAGDRDIDLRVSPVVEAQGLFAIAGQVLGPGEDGMVSLARSNEVVAKIALDDFGEFSFKELPTGVYTITLQFGAEVVALPDLEVGGAAAQP